MTRNFSNTWDDMAKLPPMNKRHNSIENILKDKFIQPRNSLDYSTKQ